jgi:endonuclease I
MWFKNKNIRTSNKNTRYVKPMWKHIIIMLTYTNMKRTWQSYGVKSCLRLMLNKLKKMRSFTSIYFPLGT